MRAVRQNKLQSTNMFTTKSFITLCVIFSITLLWTCDNPVKEAQALYSFSVPPDDVIKMVVLEITPVPASIITAMTNFYIQSGDGTSIPILPIDGSDHEISPILRWYVNLSWNSATPSLRTKLTFIIYGNTDHTGTPTKVNKTGTIEDWQFNITGIATSDMIAISAKLKSYAWNPILKAFEEYTTNEAYFTNNP
jgi:hypothetical protein